MTDTFNIFIQKYFNIFELVPSRDREQGPKPELSNLGESQLTPTGN